MSFCPDFNADDARGLMLKHDDDVRRKTQAEIKRAALAGRTSARSPGVISSGHVEDLKNQGFDVEQWTAYLEGDQIYTISWERPNPSKGDAE